MSTPQTPGDLASFVRDSDIVSVPLLTGEPSLFSGLNGDIRHDVADGVVSCRSGTTVGELNEALGKHDRCLPCLPVWPETDLRLADALLLGLPHAGEADHGSWRDWILGATMVTAEGEIVRSGSRVVKSVAGYDAHKLLVGSRGILMLPVEVTLRTFHTSIVGFPQGVQSLGDKVQSICRVLPSDFARCVSLLGSGALRVDERTGTIWSSRFVQDWRDFPYSWCIDPYCPRLPEETLPLMRRAKAVMDPTGKLSPDAFENL